jgi:hypothetical protein
MEHRENGRLNTIGGLSPKTTMAVAVVAIKAVTLLAEP